MSERKIAFREISESELMDKMKRMGFGDQERDYLRENWDEVIQEVNNHFQSDLLNKVFHNVISIIGEKAEKDDISLHIEKTIGMAVESIQKLRDSALDGLDAYLVSTKSISVSLEENAPWEYEPNFWNDALNYWFEKRETPINFWEDSVQVQKVDNGTIKIRFLNIISNPHIN